MRIPPPHTNQKGHFVSKNKMIKSGFLFVTLTLAIVLFQNCSAGGGGAAATPGTTASVVSGVAVAGAPIVGTVTIKDSSSPAITKFVTISANGSYTIDVAGLTAPFMLRADGSVGGRSYSIYSGAAAADINGNINVTPLTDLIVANIAGQLASTYFTSGNFATLTTAELNSQTSALQARLLPILTAAGVSGSIDLLRSSFAADHTGLDAALDVLRIEVDPNTAIATITSIINNQVITDNLASKADATVIDATGVAAGLTDVQLIFGTFTTFMNLFATALPSPSHATLLSIYDAAFLNEGESRSVFLSNITSDSSMIGIQFTNVSLVEGSLIPATGSPTAATVSFKVIQAGTPHDQMTWNLVKTSGTWKITGNGQIGRARVSPFARIQDTPSPNSIDSGLLVEISDSGGAGFDYAIVSGPGLPPHTVNSTLGTPPVTPQGGALYFAETSNNSFAAAQLGTLYSGDTTTPFSGNGHNQIPLSNTEIGLIADNSEYTLELYEDGGTTATLNDTLVAKYTSTIGKRPYLSTELAISSFAPISAPTPAQLWTFGSAGGVIPVSWTIPSGLFVRNLHYYRSGNGTGSNTDTLTVNIAATATTGNITMTATDSSAGVFGTLQASGINLYMQDAFGRELCTIYNGAP